MSLLTKVSSAFSKTVRRDGERLYYERAVRLAEPLQDWVEATIKDDRDGGREHVVTLSREDDGLVLFRCDCDYYEEVLQPCKHVYATILMAAGVGQVGGWDRGGRVELEAEDEFGDDDYEDNDGGEGDFASGPVLKITPRGVTRGSGGGGRKSGPLKSKRDKEAAAGKPPVWRRELLRMRQGMLAQGVEGPDSPWSSASPAASAWPADRRILYVVDLPATMEGPGLVVELAYEAPKKNGQLDRPKQLKMTASQVANLPDPQDREVLQMLMGARRGDYGYGYYGGGGYGSYHEDVPKKFILPTSGYELTLKRMCQTGRCRVRRVQGETHPGPLEWDDGPPWEFWLAVREAAAEDAPRAKGGGGAAAAKRRYVLDGELRRPGPDGQEQRMPLRTPDCLLRGGLCFAAGHVSRLEHFGTFDLLASMRRRPELVVPPEQGAQLLSDLFTLPRMPRLELPEDLRVEEVRPAPKPLLKVKPPAKRGWYGDDKLLGELSFDYGGHVIAQTQEASAVFQPEQRRVVLRDAAAERRAVARLHELGFRAEWDYESRKTKLRLPPAKLNKVVLELALEGWHVEADGKLYRQPGEFKLELTSGIDWFELHGDVDFGGGKTIGLPELLAALKRGDKTVALDDGTHGILPEQWLKKYGLLAGFGTAEGDVLKFGKNQVGLLDALLAAQPQVRTDAVFERAREELRKFEGVQPADPPAGFIGQLRPYQRDGLGWMDFLRRFGFGGCLADDMGLGKTVQVLALLEDRRTRRQPAGAKGEDAAVPGNGNGTVRVLAPSLVVAPKSLVFNWIQEAKRFAPDLKVLNHTGVERLKDAKKFGDYDLVVSTYGTVRNDVRFLKDLRFDYVVLDEAQSIKNSASESAKAARLLKGDHRLALSGTPVQNHLGELWSLFEFLNPGMLGSSSAFQVAGAGGRTIDEDARVVLSRALRPFILRRTKEQVAKDLPAKTEQTLFCELEPEQRRLYDELKEHYRRSLLSRIEREGINKAKIQILEALLRLRQAACHPGLLDPKRVDEGSAKLDALLPQLAEVTEEGHKALVFSQFTSLLAIVRKQLDKQKVVYEYLDGKTRDRQARVERFQTDKDCKLFLISLKAGGLGLNLTAAEYVFLLDPWWNPAVEAQAIDRAHRIGQSHKVFAYRLIAKDTVEEKVLALQQTKRDLADAIINADNSLIGKLGREDLELLLS